MENLNLDEQPGMDGEFEFRIVLNFDRRWRLGPARKERGLILISVYINLPPAPAPRFCQEGWRVNLNLEDSISGGGAPRIQIRTNQVKFAQRPLLFLSVLNRFKCF